MRGERVGEHIGAFAMNGYRAWSRQILPMGVRKDLGLREPNLLLPDRSLTGEV